MQAIHCKYIPASPTRPSRVKASCAAKTMIFSWDDERNHDGNMIFAAKALTKAMGWGYGRWIGGGLKDGSVVFISEYSHESFSSDTI